MYSEQLNLFLAIEHNTMRFYNPETGEVLRTLVEETQAHLADQRRADYEAERANAAEAEVARLIAELSALKQKTGQP